MADFAISAHADATARMLRRIAGELERGKPPEELGEIVQDIGTMMRRQV